jgi:hypothetical protein
MRWIYKHYREKAVVIANDFRAYFQPVFRQQECKMVYVEHNGACFGFEPYLEFAFCLEGFAVFIAVDWMDFCNGAFNAYEIGEKNLSAIVFSFAYNFVHIFISVPVTC